MEQHEGQLVALGFAEGLSPCDRYLLQRNYFPTKAGGKPAWLVPDPLPSLEEVSCPKCGLAFTFLVQLYNGNGQGRVAHRSLMVFGCQECGDEFVALRSQLPADNPFYPGELICHDDKEAPVPYLKPNNSYRFDDQNLTQRICGACGLPRTRQSGDRVENVTDTDVVMDSDSAAMKETASPKDVHQRCINSVKYGTIVAAFCETLISDDSEDLTSQKSEKQKEEEVKALASYQRYLDEVKTEGTERSLDSGECEAFEDIIKAGEASQDKDLLFSYFKFRCNELNPSNLGHVVRYCYDGQPLWHNSKGVRKLSEIPPCGACGAPRLFEFQIQTTLLSILRADRLKFAILAVFTCSSNCETTRLVDGRPSAYVKEFIYQQKDRFFPD